MKTTLKIMALSFIVFAFSANIFATSWSNDGTRSWAIPTELTHKITMKWVQEMLAKGFSITMLDGHSKDGSPHNNVVILLNYKGLVFVGNYSSKANVTNEFVDKRFIRFWPYKNGVLLQDTNFRLYMLIADGNGRLKFISPGAAFVPAINYNIELSDAGDIKAYTDYHEQFGYKSLEDGVLVPDDQETIRECNKTKCQSVEMTQIN